VLALAFAVPVTAGGPLGVAAPSSDRQLFVEDLFISPAAAPASAQDSLSAAASSPKPCNDSAYSLEGGSRWRKAYQWSFRAGSTPAGLNVGAAEAAIQAGFGNIVKANNDCGRADRVSARASYLGRTARKPSCNTSDGHNVVGFRKLAPGTAARACWWVSGNRIVEADVQINSTERWATSLVGCRSALMLEAVMTHEAGHVFGVGHVGEKRHGRLTMSTFIDGACQNSESTLGLGDMLALERLYP
jgi:hypothetical protein